MDAPAVGHIGYLLSFSTRLRPCIDLYTWVKSGHRRISMGWAQYCACVGSARLFQSPDNRLYGMLRAWAAYRHPNKGQQWIVHR
jgi:Group II intron, maturase-specific domain